MIEDVVGGAEGIKNIDSSSENGRSTIKVEFNTDIDFIKTCTKYMFKCIYLAIMHINTYKEINREFPILKILLSAWTEKTKKNII